MSIGSKIWYTWLLMTIVLCLTTWMIDEDEHPLLVNVLTALIIIPVILGLASVFVGVLLWIWK